MFEKVLRLPLLSYPTRVWVGTKSVSDKAAYIFGLLVLAVTDVDACNVVLLDIIMSLSFITGAELGTVLYVSIWFHMFNMVVFDGWVSPIVGIEGARHPRSATRGGLAGVISSSRGVSHLAGSAIFLVVEPMSPYSDHGRNGVNFGSSSPFSSGSLSSSLDRIGKKSHVCKKSDVDLLVVPSILFTLLHILWIYSLKSRAVLGLGEMPWNPPSEAPGWVDRL